MDDGCHNWWGNRRHSTCYPRMSLVFLRRRRQRQATVDSPLPDTRLPRFLLLQRKRYQWLNPGKHLYMLPPVPEAFGVPRVGLPHASIIAQLALVRADNVFIRKILLPPPPLPSSVPSHPNATFRNSAD